MFLAKNKNVPAIEIAGMLFIILLGSALHFTYALSGNNPVVGSFSAVNESVWEHLKLAFWPSILWILIAMFPLRNAVNNFFSSKAIGTYIMVIIIPAVFYSYTAITGESILAVDIATFVVAVIIGQLASLKLFKYKFPRSTEKIAVIALTLLAIVFVLFTFYPPHLPLFKDSITGRYGI